jgi:hypothetical protein
MKTSFLDRYVIARERNVVRVDFRRETDPPAPQFPGAGALRKDPPHLVNAFTTSLNKAEVA